jgi:hypothetical protein
MGAAPPERSMDRWYHGSVEEALGDFDARQVEDDECDEDAEERWWKWCEPERVVDGALGDQRPDEHNQDH